MKIEVLRDKFSENAIIGGMYIDNIFLCKTLENKFKKIKAGVYDCILRYSNKFKKLMLEILVPGREAILIHTGNSAKDTEGCIIVGMDCNNTNDYIYNSKNAYKIFWDKVCQAVVKQEKIEIEIKEV